MHILVAVEAYHPKRGAIESCIRGLARAWSQVGHKVTIVTASRDNAPDRERLPEGDVYRIEAFTDALRLPQRVIDRGDEVRAVFSSIGPDIVFATNHASAGAITAAQALGLPVVHQSAGWGLLCTHKHRLIDPDDRLCPARRGLGRCWRCKMSAYGKRGITAYRPVDYARHAHSAWLETKRARGRYDKFAKILESADYHAWMSSITKELVPNSSGSIIPNGLDANLFRPVPAEEFVRQHNIKGPYILTTSRLHHIKGISFAVEALSHLPEDFSLVVVGNSSMFTTDHLEEDNIHSREISEVVTKFGVVGRVKFVGRLEQEDLRKAYSGCLAHVTPSIWYEPFGMVAMEAMSCGAPAIVTETTGAKDMIENGKNGFIVPRCNGRAIADAVMKIHTGGEAMRQSARRSVVESATFDVVAERLLEVFNGLAGR